MDGWAELKSLIAVGSFARVGNFKERMGCIDLSRDADPIGHDHRSWSNFRAITQAGSRVFLELE